MNMLTLGNSLWAFACEIYAGADVSITCLALQDENGVDVSLLLFFAWLDRDGISLTAEQRGEVEQLLKPWHDNVIAPLRHTRRWLKQHDAEAHSTNELRQHLQDSELMGEQLGLAMLFAWRQNHGPFLQEPTANNVERYLIKSGVAAPALVSAAAIIRAARDAIELH